MTSSNGNIFRVTGHLCGRFTGPRSRSVCLQPVDSSLSGGSVSVWNGYGRLLNTLRPRQNGRHFADAIFKCIFLNENVLISIKISLKFLPKGQINNMPSLVQIMAWRRPGDKPLSEPMMVRILTHICVTRLQWVNITFVRESNTSVAVNYELGRSY